MLAFEMKFRVMIHWLDPSTTRQNISTGPLESIIAVKTTEIEYSAMNAQFPEAHTASV